VETEDEGLDTTGSDTGGGSLEGMEVLGTLEQMEGEPGPGEQVDGQGLEPIAGTLDPTASDPNVEPEDLVDPTTYKAAFDAGLIVEPPVPANHVRMHQPEDRVFVVRVDVPEQFIPYWEGQGWAPVLLG
jgi:hypothetical protein